MVMVKRRYYDMFPGSRLICFGWIMWFMLLVTWVIDSYWFRFCFHFFASRAFSCMEPPKVCSVLRGISQKLEFNLGVASCLRLSCSFFANMHICTNSSTCTNLVQIKDVEAAEASGKIWQKFVGPNSSSVLVKRWGAVSWFVGEI